MLGQFPVGYDVFPPPVWNANTATFLVAASDAPQRTKDFADYVCDGVGDQAEIQAAIDALPAVGGKVLLSEGNFLLNSANFYNNGHGNQHWYSLIIFDTHPPLTLAGTPGATVIKLADAQHDTTAMLNVTGRDRDHKRTNSTYIEDIYWDMNGTNQPDPFGGEYAPAIFVNFANGAIITKCRFNNPKIYAIEFELIGDRALVNNCYFEGGGGVLANQYNIVITNNIFDLLAAPPSPMSTGVVMSPDSDEAYPGGGVYRNYGCIVSNNVFKRGNYQVDALGTRGAIITGNVFTDKTTSYPVRIIPSGAGDGGIYNLVANNVFYNTTQGVWLYNGAQYNTIKGNVFFPGPDRNMTYAVTEQGATVGNNFITDNHFTTTNTPIRRLDGAGTGTVIKNNRGMLAFGTFTADDATPDVNLNEVYKTANVNPTTITMLDNGYAGKRVTVIINDALTTIDFSGTNLKGNVGVDWSPTSGDHMECTFDGTNWYCIVSDDTA